MAEKITDKLVRDLAAPDTGNRIVYDTEVSGFGIRATAGGSKAFILNYRNGEGRERRLTIGAYGKDAWSVEAARKRAGELRREIDKGNDPLAAKIEKRDGTTVADLCDLYEEHHLPTKRPASARDDKQMLKGIIRPKLGTQKADSPALGTEIGKLHRSMKATPYRANRVLALVSTMFNLGITQWRVCKENPAKGIGKFHEAKRKRYLKSEEVARLTVALAKHEDQVSANVLRLCLFTGARVGEAMGARWEQFDLDGETPIWSKPAASTKQDEDHEVPLSTEAVKLLTAIKGDGELVFPSDNPESPIPYKRVNQAWGEIRTAAKIPDVRIHDLRHSFASFLVSNGQSLPVVGALLGHTQAATTQRYAHLLREPLKAAVDTVGAIIAGKPKAKIVKAGAA